MFKFVAVLSASVMLLVCSSSWALPMPGPTTYGQKQWVKGFSAKNWKLEAGRM